VSLRVALILGTRPEIIKLAPVIVALKAHCIEHHVVHTNQHYSNELDSAFFEELELDPPAVNLGVGSGDHGQQTGRMLERLEEAIRELDANYVIVQGDTNSGLAGALAAAKMPCAVAHVEAGLRSFDRRMPEEVNRRAIDHLADDLFPPTDLSRENLTCERVPGVVHEPTGNTIVDAVLRYAERVRVPVSERSPYILVTFHRAENVDHPVVLKNLVRGIAAVAEEHSLDVVFPAHPRSLKRCAEFGVRLPKVFTVVSPTPFRTLLQLQANARLVMTDAGGLQDESCVLGTPCVTLRTTTERPETVQVGANMLGGVTVASIVAAAKAMLARADVLWPQPLGDGFAGARIVDILVSPGDRLAGRHEMLDFGHEQPAQRAHVRHP
jgi:UDP-N-acetylglucosamine 2-epimerase (non-hydrolysing)